MKLTSRSRMLFRVVVRCARWVPVSHWQRWAIRLRRRQALQVNPTPDHPAPSPIRHGISARGARPRLISGIPMSLRSIRASTASRSRMHRSSGCGPARCGPKGRPGMPRGAISSGATFPTTGSCAGWRTMAGSRCFAIRQTTAMATPSISRVGSFPASISRGAWCATSLMVPSPCLQTGLTGSGSTRPMTWSPIQMAATGSPIRPMAANCMKARRMWPEGQVMRMAG